MARTTIKATGAPMVTRGLTTFLRETLHTIRDDDEEARFANVRVFQIVKGKRGEETFSIIVPRKPSENWPESTALDIFVRLQAEAGVLRGLQKWGVYSYFSHDLDSHVGRFLIALQGGNDETDDLETEGPDKEGLVRQMQRHTEALMKINVSQQMTSHTALAGLVTTLGEQVTTLIQQRKESLDLEEQIRNDLHARELESRVAEKRMEAIVDIGKKVGMFVPAIANKLAGQQLFPVQGSAVTMMLKGLMGSIMADEKRASALMGMLNTEEQVVFMQLFEEVGKSPDGSEGATAVDNNGQGPT